MAHKLHGLTALDFERFRTAKRSKRCSAASLRGRACENIKWLENDITREGLDTHSQILCHRPYKVKRSSMGGCRFHDRLHQVEVVRQIHINFVELLFAIDMAQSVSVIDHCEQLFIALFIDILGSVKALNGHFRRK